MNKFLIIDTFNFLHRAYHALPNTFRDSAGEPVNAVYGVTSMLVNVLNKLGPQYAVSALDSKEPNFRLESFTGYKAHRRPMDNELSTQIPKVIEMMEAFGFKNVVIPGYEADDIVGTLVNKFSKDTEIVVISNDRDLWQLIGPSVKIAVPNKSGGFDYIDTKTCEDTFGFSCNKIPDYKGLRGDPSDNIPGVYGVGEVSAKKLINEYGTMEKIYENIESIKPESLKKKLAENYETAMMSKKLATIEINAPLTISLSECKHTGLHKDKVETLLRNYNFKSLMRRLGIEDVKSKQPENTNQLGLNL